MNYRFRALKVLLQYNDYDYDLVMLNNCYRVNLSATIIIVTEQPIHYLRNFNSPNPKYTRALSSANEDPKIPHSLRNYRLFYSSLGNNSQQQLSSHREGNSCENSSTPLSFSLSLSLKIPSKGPPTRGQTFLRLYSFYFVLPSSPASVYARV